MILGKTRKGASTANKLFIKRQLSKYYIVKMEKKINLNKIKFETFSYQNKNYQNVKIQDDQGILVSSYINDDIEDEKQFKMKYDYQQGKFSQTLFYPIQDNIDEQNLFIVKLLTGRRHQIRIHSLILGSCIKNDLTYSQQELQQDSILCLHSLFTVIQCINNGEPLIANCDWIDTNTYKTIINQIYNLEHQSK